MYPTSWTGTQALTCEQDDAGRTSGNLPTRFVLLPENLGDDLNWQAQRQEFSPWIGRRILDFPDHDEPAYSDEQVFLARVADKAKVRRVVAGDPIWKSIHVRAQPDVERRRAIIAICGPG